MATLFDLTYAVAALLGNLREGKATGGSTTTLVDTVGLAGFDLDYFNGGTVWITKTNDGLPPQGQYSVVSDFVSASKTVTLLDAITAIQAGDRYAISNDRFPLYQIIQKINSARNDLGMIPSTDVSLTTAEGKRFYDLPNVGATIDLREVHWLDQSIERWHEVLNWDFQYTAGGTPEKLILDYDLPAGVTLRLTYAVDHGELRDIGDTLNEVVHPSRIIFDAAADCLRDYMEKTRLKDYQPKYDRLLEKAALARLNHQLPPLRERPNRLTLIDLANRDTQWQ